MICFLLVRCLLKELLSIYVLREIFSLKETLGSFCHRVPLRRFLSIGDLLKCFSLDGLSRGLSIEGNFRGLLAIEGLLKMFPSRESFEMLLLLPSIEGFSRRLSSIEYILRGVFSLWNHHRFISVSAHF